MTIVELIVAWVSLAFFAGILLIPLALIAFGMGVSVQSIAIVSGVVILVGPLIIGAVLFLWGFVSEGLRSTRNRPF